MSRDVFVARTSHDLDHVNRLAMPGFGLVDFRLTKGAKKSKFYRPDGSPMPPSGAPPETGKDDFHFIPEYEEVAIEYEIDDRAGMVKGLKLELFTRFQEDALWELDFDKLGDTWWKHGKHTVKWDGRIVNPTAKADGTENDGKIEHDLTTLPEEKSDDKFPDGYATLEYPPYKFRLTLVSDYEEHGNPLWGWTYWEILLHGLELELGPEEAIPAGALDDDQHKRDKATRQKLQDDGGVPDEGGEVKVMLVSNIFKTDGNEMGTNMSFSEYKSQWEDGASIPVFAKIRLKDSGDAEVKVDEAAKGAKALGNVQFLWDWEDPEEDTGAVLGGQAKAKKFVDQALKFKKKATDESPKGDNCHVDRGGKRGPSAKRIFPDQDGYDAKSPLDAGKFPFEVEPAETRKWASLSKCWREGAAKGKTGVVFQPSRMAGDDYELTVYLANDRKKEKGKVDKVFDIKDEKLKAVDAIKKKSGKFVVWRELHLVKYVRKQGTIADFVASHAGDVRQHYDYAYVHVEDKTVKSNLAVGNYNDLARAQITSTGDSLMDYAVDPAADHSASSSAFEVRSFADMRQKVLDAFIALNPTSDPADLEDPVDQWLAGEGIGDDDQYCYAIEAKLKEAAKALTGDLNQLNGAPDGITIVEFNYVTTARAGNDQGGILGSAIDVPGATRNKCLFVFFYPAVDTFVHEIGHHLFLAHFGPKPDDYDARYHDKHDKACIMSYNRPRPTFCGYCLLRLRGWDADAMSADGGRNSS